MMGFSGWNVLANLSETLKNQGYLVLLNMFFQPVVVAAQTISNQVAGAMMQFIGNFRTAINPQIIKYYAVEDYESSKQLTLSTTVLVFDLVLLLGLPTTFVMNTIMSIWLVEVPAYAVIFTQYVIINRIISTFDASFYIPMMAASKVKTNSLLSVFLGPGSFIVLYVIIGATMAVNERLKTEPIATPATPIPGKLDKYTERGILIIAPITEAIVVCFIKPIPVR